MRISGTTINMATKRNVDISIIEADSFSGASHTGQPTVTGTLVEFSAIEDGEPADEFHAMYHLKPNGLFLVCKIHGSDEWPAWISSDQHLRGMLDAMQADMA